MKIILDELNSKEFFSNGGVVKITLKNAELISLSSDRKKFVFFDNKNYVRFMREIYLKYISKHQDVSKGVAYERVNEMLEISSYIGDKHYTLDPGYDNNKSLEMCLFYYCGDNDTYEFSYNRDPYGIKNVNFSIVDEADDKWEDFCNQRIERGFDDTELWSLDATIARFVLPRLKAFRDLSPDSPEELSKEAWDKILNDIVTGFELIVDDKTKTKEEDAIIEDALDLFREWYRDFWF